jgi:hypothetical protein
MHTKHSVRQLRLSNHIRIKAKFRIIIGASIFHTLITKRWPLVDHLGSSIAMLLAKYAILQSQGQNLRPYKIESTSRNLQFAF